MRYDDEEDQKGLFTFYREQAEEEESHKSTKKKKKNKKKNLRKSAQNKIIECPDSSDGEQKSKNQSVPEAEKHTFLKNIVRKRSKVIFSSQIEGTLPMRTNTQPNKDLHELKPQNVLIKQRVMDSSLLKAQIQKNAFRWQDKQQMQFHKYLEDSNKKINNLHNKIKDQDIFKSPKGHEGIRIAKIQPLKLKEGEKIKISGQVEEKTFLEKLKFLDRKSKSNLINNRESARNSGRTDLHDQNKKYFHQLISNFYKHSQSKSSSAYKILKQALKFPTISQIPNNRMKTEHTSPHLRHNSPIIHPPARSLSHKKDLLKSKHSSQKYSELFKKHLANKIRQSQSSYDGRTLNLINLSQQYGKETVESEERKQKKKIVKLKLGIEL